MHYVGRHRTARPFYLRRPVIGGALLATVIAVPALALTGQGPGLLGAKEPVSPTTSKASPAAVIPTDGALPSDSPVAPTSRATTSASTSAPASSSAAPGTSAAQTTAPTTTTTSRTTTKPPTKTTSTTTTKPADPPLKTTLSAPGATVGVAYVGSITASGGSGTYTISSSGRPAWLNSFVATGNKATFSGTPTAAGTAAFSITVKSGSQSRTVLVSITIKAATPASSAA